MGVGGGGKRVPPSGVYDSPVITGLTSTQGKTKLDVLFHLVNRLCHKHEPRDAPSQGTNTPSIEVRRTGPPQQNLAVGKGKDFPFIGY